MSLKPRRNRIMIIVWAWQHGGMISTVDEWSVAGQDQNGDRIICIDQPASAGGRELISEKIRKNLPKGDIYLFLHRSHGYTPASIAEILMEAAPCAGKEKLLRCFLFGEGNDYIYITKQPRGLLGARGTFSARIGIGQSLNGTERLITAVDSLEDKVIRRAHFDFVWKFYTNSFKAKIFELKEDLLAFLFRRLAEGEFQPGAWYQLIKREENRLLLLRLISFTGKMRKGSGLEDELKRFEQQQKRSFLFDDCHINLKMLYGESESRLYEELAHGINRSLLGGAQPCDLPRIRDQFDALLEAMPEAAYY